MFFNFVFSLFIDVFIETSHCLSIFFNIFPIESQLVAYLLSIIYCFSLRSFLVLFKIQASFGLMISHELIWFFKNVISYWTLSLAASCTLNSSINNTIHFVNERKNLLDFDKKVFFCTIITKASFKDKSNQILSKNAVFI